MGTRNERDKVSNRLNSDLQSADTLNMNELWSKLKMIIIESATDNGRYRSPENIGFVKKKRRIINTKWIGADKVQKG